MNVPNGCHAIMWKYTLSQYHWGLGNYAVSSADLHGLTCGIVRYKAK